MNLKSLLKHIKTKATALLTLMSHKSQTKRHKTTVMKKIFANDKQFLMEQENHFNCFQETTTMFQETTTTLLDAIAYYFLFQTLLATVTKFKFFCSIML